MGRRNIGTLVAIFSLAIAGNAPAATTAPTTRPTISNADFDDALQKAVTLSADDLQQDLAPVASRFQTVDVCTSAGRMMWSFRTLNQRGKGFDALRFRVPGGNRTHFYWAFSVPNLSEFYIEPVKGRHLRMFEDYYGPEPAKYDLLGPLNKNLILQQSPIRLEANAEYLLWFKLKTTKRVTFVGSVVMLNNDDDDRIESIEKAVGLKSVDDGR